MSSVDKYDQWLINQAVGDEPKQVATDWRGNELYQGDDFAELDGEFFKLDDSLEFLTNYLGAEIIDTEEMA